MTARSNTSTTVFNLSPGGSAASLSRVDPNPVSPAWTPGSSYPQAEEDTLCLLQPSTEQQVLASGGRLHTAVQTYYAQTRATLGTGPFTGKSFPEDSNGNRHAVYPLDGCLPADEFTIEFQAKSKALDYRSQSTNLWIMSIADDSGAYLRLTGTPANGQVSCRFIDSTDTPGPEAVMTLIAGDWPADTWKAFSVTYSGGTLKLMLGDNVRSGSASASMPVANWGGGSTNANSGIMPAGAPRSGTTGPYEVADFHIRRFARTYNTKLTYKRPTVTVDAGTSSGAFPTDLFGVFAQYPGWRDTQIDGQTGGGGPGITGNAIRNSLVATQAAAGLKLVRIDHIFDKIGITGSNPYTYDWTKLDDSMDLLNASGFKFHITFGYTPSLLGATTNAPPSSSANFAQMCSDALSHWVTTKGYTIHSVSLWNEPEGASFWSGNTTQYTTLWGAVQAKLATDWPAYPLGGPSAGSAVKTVGGYQRALIDYCAAHAITPGNITTHNYTSSPADFSFEVAAIRAYLISTGVPNAASVPIGVTEWNLNDAMAKQLHDTSGASDNSLAKTVKIFRDETQPAFAHAMLSQILAAGASFGTYTRMGILDSFFFPGVEEELGLFTNANPPVALPVYAAFQGMWKHAGNRVLASGNYPYLSALASKAVSGKVVVTFANYRPFNRTERKNIAFEWSGLPRTYTWTLSRMDSRDASQGLLLPVASGDQTNPPMTVELEALGFGCIEITP